MFFIRSLIALSFINIFAATSTYAQEKKSYLRLADNVDWGYLNPLRGKKSPAAADLWGNRTKDLATGMLVKFHKGFSSPPHIHNITYRGIVIQGLLHNDDPSAEKMWMPPGSFWTQPAGEQHITAANGEANLIYLEIDKGPYLVKPSKQQFQSGVNPINQHFSNLVWLDQNDLPALGSSGAELATLWGSNKSSEPGGIMLKLPTGFDAKLHVNAQEFRAVVIRGKIKYNSIETPESISLSPGSHFGSQVKFTHNLSTSQHSLLYIRTNGNYQIEAN